METLESLVRFFGSYPLWARVFAGAGLAITTFTLLLAPRTEVEAKPKSNENGAWLIVEGVDVFGSYRDAQVRVDAIVNGTHFVYPTLEGVEWLAVGPTMAAQQFRLPRPGRNGYDIQMTMALRSQGESYDLKSVEHIFVKAIPFAGEYELHTVEGGVRGAGIDATVRFRISADPNA